MCFGKNGLFLKHLPTNTTISFSTMEALDVVDKEKVPFKLSYSEEWNRLREDESKKIKDVVKPYDWTYTTNFRGNVVLPEGKAIEPSEIGIDYVKLAAREPIIYFDQVDLFEDELADNGIASLQIKVRVMPSGFFVLQRFFLRVDDVIIRIYDSRIHHEFGRPYFLREYNCREDTFVNAQKLAVSGGIHAGHPQEIQFFSEKLPSISVVTEKIPL